MGEEKRILEAKYKRAARVEKLAEDVLIAMCIERAVRLDVEATAVISFAHAEAFVTEAEKRKDAIR